MKKLLYCGAEAELYETEYLGLPAVEKKRVEKKYRARLLDEKIRADRVRREASIILEAHRAAGTPRVYDVDLDSKSFTMEFVHGTRVRDLSADGIAKVSPQIGRAVKRLHAQNIVHGDLTTSNILMGKGRLCFVDFGLAFKSEKLEDKAVDLLVFKKMLKSTHFSCFDAAWRGFLRGYKPSRVLLSKISEVEARARYAEK